MYAPGGFTPYFTVLVGVAVLVLWILGGVAAAIAVTLNSRSRGHRHAGSARAATPDATRLILIFVLYGAAVLGLIVGIVLGNVTGPAGPSFTCPSVFQWNGLGSIEQGLISAFDGGQCTGHVGRMTAAMVFAFVLAAVVAVVATVLTVARLMRGSRSQVSPPAWHPVAGDPGKLRWWDGTAWTNQIHDQNGSQS